MKTKKVILVIILFVLALLLFLRKSEKQAAIVVNENIDSIGGVSAGTPIKNSSITNGYVQDQQAEVFTNKIGEFKRREQALIKLWKVPIEFYGRVVDENQSPVPEADIRFSWIDLTPKGTDEKLTKSDVAGSFSLSGVLGKRLYVYVAKDGYYSPKANAGRTFEYAEPIHPDFHSPEQSSPVVFHLRRKGTGVSLITSQNGIKPSLRIMATTNGEPIYVDLIKGEIGNVGQLKIQTWKGGEINSSRKNDWRFLVSVPDGGLTEFEQEFPFEAPENGYGKSYELNFSHDDISWRGTIERSFFIRFGSSARYGRITIRTTAFSPVVYLEYVINPDGSRNLEPKNERPEINNSLQQKPTVYE